MALQPAFSDELDIGEVYGMDEVSPLCVLVVNMCCYAICAS